MSALRTSLRPVVATTTSAAAALLLALAGPGAAAAQQPAPAAPAAPRSVVYRPPVADTGIFSPVPLAPPDVYRSADGSPGPRYWQQRADYTIRATLDTAQQRLTGQVRIRYTNNSPDTLRFVWLQMDQNLFRPGSTGSLLFAAGSRFGGAGFQGGFEVDRLVEERTAARPAARAGRGARPAPASTAAGAPLKSRVDDTMMQVDLSAPLAPGAATTLVVDYHFAIPEHGADRMGREGSLYELAQWYPRMAVYDEVHGWNTIQYLGQGEFYLEYGDFDYQVTVPAGYIVAGTGTLVNPQEVLTATQRARLAQAAKSDTTIHVVTAEELASGAARPTRSGTATWHFRAKDVRDAAWAASPEYLWDASSWEGILAHAYYRPSAVATWKDAAKMSRFSIQEYSTRWFRYPYPQISAIEGPVSGMEYPMVAMEAKGDSPEDLYNVVTHEIGHMWYPMIVGSDERRYAWMDEGFNTFINTFSEEDYWKRNDTPTRRQEARFVFMLDQQPTAQAIMTPANRYLNNNNLGSLAYVKPSIVLLALRNKVLGPEVFDRAFREYTRRWAFKHPQPSDFFRTMENVSGEELSWFWRQFFFTTAVLDQAVESVQQSGGEAQVVLRNLGSAVMPVELELTYADGQKEVVRFPVEIWYGGNRYVARVPAPKPIVAARVNPDGGFPDVNASNDAWSNAPTTR
ncbi:MAG TPA: M1 family metallopeptidase [Gemmatimonadales bacterium]|nr:M1 family metallopeptidase [Gemmatimonadales bacterium]